MSSRLNGVKIVSKLAVAFLVIFHKLKVEQPHKYVRLLMSLIKKLSRIKVFHLKLLSHLSLPGNPTYVPEWKREGVESCLMHQEFPIKSVCLMLWFRIRTCPWSTLSTHAPLAVHIGRSYTVPRQHCLKGQGERLSYHRLNFLCCLHLKFKIERDSRKKCRSINHVADSFKVPVPFNYSFSDFRPFIKCVF